VTPSFRIAMIIRGDRRFAILGHQHLPLLAIAAAPAGHGAAITFTGAPDAAATLASQASFRLLSPANYTG
jgi:hypothetical protein